MVWTPQPMQVFTLDPFYATRRSGEPLSVTHRTVHPLGAKILIELQDELLKQASDEWPKTQPIVVYNSMMRGNAFQYRLIKENKPRGIPTAVVGGSLHAFGLAVDIDVRGTMANINKAGLDASFEEFRQYLAGMGAVGIQSEAWHFNLMLRPRYYEWAGWKLRDTLYSANWTGLTDEQKEDLLTALGHVSASLHTKTIEFQSKYSDSLQIDGKCGPKTTRAAYVEWAHANFQYVDF